MTQLLAVQTVGTLAERAGGPPRTVSSLCAALTRTDVAIELVSGCTDDDGARMLPPGGHPQVRFVHGVRRLGITGYPGTAGAVRAAVAAHAHAHAVLHDNGIWAASNIAAIGAARAAGLPYVISPHGMLEPWAMAYHGGRKRLAWAAYQRRALSGSAGLLATAEQERVAIRRLFPRLPVAVIANGVDCPAVAPPTDPASTTVLFMSRVHPIKNLIGLIDAWAGLCADPRFAAWRLAIAGPDEVGHVADIRRHAERCGVAARVDFLGPAADVDKAALLAQSAVLVLPSFSENFGVVVAEALAAGLPVIAAHGAPWDELPRRGAGWWVSPDAGALRDALVEALSLSPGERRAMGERGHAYVAAAFGWERIAAATASFYRWIIEGGKAPDFVDC
jgi:glycosyltransferase involved in cell wall biosynthesis